jgi:hypothetical protein
LQIDIILQKWQKKMFNENVTVANTSQVASPIVARCSCFILAISHYAVNLGWSISAAQGKKASAAHLPFEHL